MPARSQRRGAVGVTLGLIALLSGLSGAAVQAQELDSEEPEAQGFNTPEDLFQGHWSGITLQTNAQRSYDVEIYLDSLEEIEIDYPGIRCKSYVSGAILRGSTIIGTQVLTDGEDRCVDGGRISLRLTDDAVLVYQWTHPTNPEITARANTQKLDNRP